MVDDEVTDWRHGRISSSPVTGPQERDEEVNVGCLNPPSPFLADKKGTA